METHAHYLLDNHIDDSGYTKLVTIYTNNDLHPIDNITMENDSDKDDDSHISLLGEIVSSTYMPSSILPYGIEYHLIASCKSMHN